MNSRLPQAFSGIVLTYKIKRKLLFELNLIEPKSTLALIIVNNIIVFQNSSKNSLFCKYM